MKFLLEFNSYYKVGDIVLIEYFYNDIITPCIITEIISKQRYKVSHKLPKESKVKSKLFNAPDEIIKKSDIIDISR